MNIAKRVLSMAVVALSLSMYILPALAAPLQQVPLPDESFEADTVAVVTDILPEIEMPGNLVSGELIRQRFATLQQNLPLLYNKESHKFVEYFIYTKPDFTRRMMEQKNLYFPIYEKALAKYDMPDEIKYLSMIESGLNPRILSRAGAGGLWQFMRATGREFGLKQDAYFDERFDPEKSTEAACRYLRQLYNIFGDWEMALASYNCGPGNVKRAMRRTGGNTFWSVYDALPKETRSYVPQFVGIMYMMHYGEDHGIVPQDIMYPTVTDVIKVNGYLNLATFSSLSGVTMEEIQRLNPQIINTVLPDYTSDFSLRIPAQKYALMEPNRLAILDSASKRPTTGVMLASLEEEDEAGYATRNVRHTVRSGETLTAVARRYGVGVSEIKRWNKMRSNRLMRGQRLTIVRQVRIAPKPQSETRVAKAEKPTVETAEATEDTTETETLVADVREEIEVEAQEEEVKVARSTKPQIAARSVTHTVRRGDNLTVLSRKYRVSIEELKVWNDLSSGKLMPGQKIKVTVPTTAMPLAKLAANKVKKETPKVKARYHTVQRGDTLWTISQRYGLTIDKIKHANNMRSNSIKAGMKLLISG